MYDFKSLSMKKNSMEKWKLWLSYFNRKKQNGNYISQGRLKIWTEHSTLILLISIPFELAQQKFQDFYNYGRNEFSPNLKSVAQKLGLPRPFEVLDVFGRKSKSEALRVFKFGPKRVPNEVNNWWKFGVDISNHFWKIQNLSFFVFQVSPTM